MDQQPHKQVIPFPISKAQLAQLYGLPPSTFGRKLQALKQDATDIWPRTCWNDQLLTPRQLQHIIEEWGCPPGYIYN